MSIHYRWHRKQNNGCFSFCASSAVQSFMEQIWQHIGSCNSESYFPLTEPCIWGSCGAREPGNSRQDSLVSRTEVSFSSLAHRALHHPGGEDHQPIHEGEDLAIEMCKSDLPPRLERLQCKATLEPRTQWRLWPPSEERKTTSSHLGSKD